jgi:ribosomal protein L11 methyltransferase
MNTYLIKFTLSQIQADTAEAVVYMSPLDGALYGVERRDYSDMEAVVEQITGTTLIDETLLAKDKTTADICVYTSTEADRETIETFVSARLTELDIPFTSSKEDIKSEDWENNWKEFYRPMEIGEKFLVCPSWEQCPENTDKVVLTLDPGLAFGTGRHETTQLCLEALEQTDLQGKTVIDIGTGSGILAIAAKKLGAGQTFGVDIDPLSVKTAAENAKENVAEISFELCNLLEEPLPFAEEKYGVVVMNIVADIIIKMLPIVKGFAAPNGTLVLSGIIAGRLDDVTVALAENGMSAQSVTADKEWRCVVASV